MIPLLQKYEKDSHDKTEKGREMIPLDRLPFEKKGYDYSEYRQWNGFLNDLQLHDIERTAVAGKAEAVRRDLGAIFEECQSPWQKNHKDNRPSGRNFHFLKLEMPIPGERHENIGRNKQQNSENRFHFLLINYIIFISVGKCKQNLLFLRQISKLAC